MAVNLRKRVAVLPPIIIYGLCRWDYIVNRPQNLALEFAKHTRVFYIDPPVSAGEEATSVRAVVDHLRAPVTECHAVEGGVTLVSTRARYPFPGKSDCVNGANIRLIRREIERIVKGLDRPPILWVMYPSDRRLFSGLHPSVLVYDLVDRHAHFPGQPAKYLERLRSNEEWLFEHADLVTVTSKSLRDYAVSAGARAVAVVPNGAAAEHFRTAIRAPRPGGDPVIGYVGAIGEWFDFSAIRSLAASLPNATILLAGPFHAPVTGLPDGLPPRVKHVGVIPFADLPRFVEGLDLCLIPFAVDDMTRAVNPVKVYEYLAAGKPVLSTPLPEVVALGSVVDTSPADAFGESAIRILANDSPAKVQERVRIAQENGWGARVATAIEALEPLLNRQTCGSEHE
jgi:glycosyltransferase involved in cell wall biosynthesis